MEDDLVNDREQIPGRVGDEISWSQRDSPITAQGAALGNPTFKMSPNRTALV